MGTKKTKTKKTKKQKTKQKNLCLYIVIFQSGFDVQGHNQEYVVLETMWSAGEIAAHKKKKAVQVSQLEVTTSPPSLYFENEQKYQLRPRRKCGHQARLWPMWLPFFSKEEDPAFLANDSARHSSQLLALGTGLLLWLKTIK